MEARVTNFGTVTVTLADGSFVHTTMYSCKSDAVEMLRREGYWFKTFCPKGAEIWSRAEIDMQFVEPTNVQLNMYCEHCLVVAIIPGEKYCASCADEVCSYLAVQYNEQQLADEGLN